MSSRPGEIFTTFGETKPVPSKPLPSRSGSGLRRSPTFVFLLRSANLLYFLGGLHEEREDGPEPKNVHKLVAVVGSLGANHGVIQHFQGAAPGDFLFPGKRKSVNAPMMQAKHPTQQYLSYVSPTEREPLEKGGAEWTEQHQLSKSLGQQDWQDLGEHPLVTRDEKVGGKPRLCSSALEGDFSAGL